MTTAPMDEPAKRKPLRLWPGVLAVVLQWLAWFVLPIVVPEATLYGFLGGILGGGLAVLVWWLFFSRAPWSERVGAIVLMVVALFATSRIVHESIANGVMGMMFPMFAIPVLSLALVCWAVASRRLSSGPRRALLVATILLACGVFTLLRTGGMSGDGHSDLHWRWTQTPEERLLALADNEPAALPSAVTASEERRRLARLSRTRSRRHRSRRTDRDRLVSVAAGRAVAPADRTGLVVVRGPRRPPLYPGAARRGRGRRLLQRDHRPAGLEAPRRGPVLGVEWRRRPARDANP